MSAVDLAGGWVSGGSAYCERLFVSLISLGREAFPDRNTEHVQMLLRGHRQRRRRRQLLATISRVPVFDVLRVEDWSCLDSVSLAED